MHDGSNRGPWVDRLRRAMRRLGALLLLLTLLVLPGGLGGCPRSDSAEPGASPRRPSVPVTVALAEQRDVPVLVQAIARGEPYRTVTIKPQVSGRISHVHFEEGDHVDEGDLLFTIDARPFEATLRQAEAILAKDEALAEDAAAEANWQTELHSRAVTAQREYETALAQAAALRAAVAADQAAVESARLQLEYCTIRAPISGRTGSRLADPGSVVKANEAELVVLNQISPLYVVFSVPERHLAAIKEYQAAGPLAVVAEMPEGGGPPENGELTFIDNKVDDTTGMIVLKGTFANEQQRLWPGQYLRAVLTLTMRPEAVVVPSAAVQIGQGGQFVYVMKDDATVEARPVQTGPALADKVVVENGLAAGERVVTDGQLRLTPGAAVQVRAASQPATPGTAATQDTHP